MARGVGHFELYERATAALFASSPDSPLRPALRAEARAAAARLAGHVARCGGELTRGGLLYVSDGSRLTVTLYAEARTDGNPLRPPRGPLA